MKMILKVAIAARFLLLGIVFTTGAYLVFDPVFTEKSNMLRGLLIMICIAVFMFLDTLYWSIKRKEIIDKLVVKLENYQPQVEE